MKKNKTTKKQRFETLEAYVNSMRKNKGFNLKNLCRTISPFVRTFHINNLFCLSDRKTKKGFTANIVVSVDSDPLLTCVHIERFPKPSFTLYCDSNKEFLQKVIKHRLL